MNVMTEHSSAITTHNVETTLGVTDAHAVLDILEMERNVQVGQHAVAASVKKFHNFSQFPNNICKGA